MPASRNSQNNPNIGRSKGYVATSAAEYEAHQAALAAERRFGQIQANTQQAIGAIKSQNFADSDVKRKALQEAQSNQSRAQQGMSELNQAKASGASAQEIKKIHDKYAISEQTLKQQRQSKSTAASVTAARRAAAKGSSTVQRIVPSIYQPLAGTSSNPIRGQQPDRSLVSPYLKASTQVTVRSADGKERTFDNRDKAEKYIQRIKGDYDVTESQVQAPAGTLQSIYGQTDEFNGIVGDLTNTYGKPQQTYLGEATEKTLTALDEFQRSRPSSPVESVLRTFVDPFVGFSKASLATFASFGNLGTQAGALVKGRPPKNAMIQVPETFVSTAIDNVLSGKSASQQASSAYAYIQSRGIMSTIGEVGELAIGAGGGIKTAAKIIPIRASKYEQAGVKVTESILTKGKTAINTPKIITKEAPIRSIEIGYGTRKVPVISKVGEKINIGAPKLDNVRVEIAPVTKKQLDRGVKMAADSTQYEQRVNVGLIKRTSTLSKGEQEKASIIEEIVQITTKPSKDTTTATKLGKNTFSSVTATEQPSFVKALSKAQKKLINPIGSYEGSLSHSYFVLPKYLRQAGDVDLHAKSYSRAAKQVKDIVPKIVPDEGRSFFYKTSAKSKSAKGFVLDTKTGKKEKIIEILNPEEVDEKGVSQAVEGSTLFGKRIPSTKYKVFEGKTYGRQRQILKKGESIYSIQSTPTGLKLEPVEFRKKDIADFYALVESARVMEFSAGSKESKRLSHLLTKYKASYDFDIDAYLAKNRYAEPISITAERSTLQRSASSFGRSSYGSLKASTPLLKRSSYLSSNERSFGGKSFGTRPSLGSRSPPSNPRGSSMGRIRTKSLSTFDSPPSKLNVSPKNKPTKLSLLGSSPPSKSTGSLTSGGKSSGFSRGGSGINRSGFVTSEKIPRKAILPAIFKLKTKDAKRIEEKRKRRDDFLGNTNVESISGFRTKKSDITYGEGLTSKLERENVLFTRRKPSKSRKKKTPSIF